MTDGEAREQFEKWASTRSLDHVQTLRYGNVWEQAYEAGRLAGLEAAEAGRDSPLVEQDGEVIKYTRHAEESLDGCDPTTCLNREHWFYEVFVPRGREQVERLRAALERLKWNFELLLAGKPVREASEALAEAEEALATQVPTAPKKP